LTPSRVSETSAQRIQADAHQGRTLGNNLRMIDPPTLPTAPSYPKKSLFLLSERSSGCRWNCLGICADAFDDSVKHHTEIEREFGIRKLGPCLDVKKLAALHKLDEEFTDFEFVAHDKPKSPNVRTRYGMFRPRWFFPTWKIQSGRCVCPARSLERVRRSLQCLWPLCLHLRRQAVSWWMRIAQARSTKHWDMKKQALVWPTYSME